MAGVGLPLMGRCWTVLSRGLTDYAYDQQFSVTSFLPATCVHGGLCESDLRGWLNSSVTCLLCRPDSPPKSSREAQQTLTPPGGARWHCAYFLFVLGIPVTNTAFCPLQNSSFP